MNGDFAAAERDAPSLEDPDAAEATLSIAIETADLTRALPLARDCLNRRAAHVDGKGSVELAILVEERAGILSHANARQMRHAAVEREVANMGSDAWGDMRWWRFGIFTNYFSYTGYLDTKADAQAALEELGEPLDLPASMRLRRGAAMGAAELGYAAVLTGDVERGLPFMEAYAKMCDVIGISTFEYMRNLLHLGIARETRDANGACEAYAAILARWGNAKPRSVTADEARRRSGALGCGHRDAR